MIFGGRLPLRPWRVGALLGLGLVLLVAELSAQSVRTQLGHDPLYVGQESEYRVLVESAVTGFSEDVAVQASMPLPEVEGLEFELVDQGLTNVRRSTTLINGRFSSRSSADYVFVYRLRAERAGNYTVPAPVVELDGKSYRGRASALRVEDSDSMDLARVRLRCEPPSLFLGGEGLIVLEVDLKFIPAPRPEDRNPLSQYDLGNIFEPGIPPPMLRVPWIVERLQGLGDIDVDAWAQARQVRRGLRFAVDEGAVRGRFAERSRIEEVKAPDAEGRETSYLRLQFTLPVRGEIAGVHELPAATLTGQLVDEEGSRLVWRNVFATSQPLRLEVREPPVEARPASFRGAVGSFRFSMEPPAPTTLRVADPVFVTLIVQGRGFLKGVQLDLGSILGDRFRVERVGVIDSLPDGVERPAGFPDRPGRWRQWDYKVFPLDPGVSEIPEIPFAWYDPDEERYVEQRTEAVPLTVSEAGPGSGAVVSPDAGARRSDVELVATSALSENVGDLNLLADQRPSLTPTYATLGGLLLAYCGLAVAVRRHRRRQDDPSLGRRSKAATRARRRLGAAQSSGDAAAALDALRGYVADREAGDEEALTGAALVEWCRAGGLSEESCARVQTLSDTVEMAAFGGGASEGEVRDLLQGLDGVLREAEQRRRSAGRVRASVLGLAAALVLLGSAARAQDLQRFEEAQRATEAGDWAAAAAAYEGMLGEDYENGYVLFNLGNCYLREGRLGAAIASYRRARLYLPADANLEVNLQRALDARSAPLSLPDDGSWLDYVLFWRGRLSFRQELTWTLALAGLAFVLAVLRLLLRAPPAGLAWGVGLALAAMLLTGASAVLDHDALQSRDHGAITAEGTVLRAGPGESFEARYEQPVGDGAEFEVLATREEWIKVEVGGKYEGWVPRVVVALW